MKKFRIIFSLASLVGLFAFVPAHAQVSASNDTTGADSENKAKIEISNNVDIRVDNDNSVKNILDFHLKSGENEASYNTGSGAVTTGDISVESVIENEIETVSVDFENIGGFEFEANVENAKTGYDSENKTSVKINNRSEVSIKNDTDIDNHCSIKATTGGNEASYNTGNGTVSSGGISLECNVENEVGGGEGVEPTPPPVTPPAGGGGMGGGTFPPVATASGGMGGGTFEFPEELPRAGQGLLALLGLSLLGGSIALGSKKLAMKYLKA